MATIGKRSAEMLDTVDPKLRDIVRKAIIAAPAWLDFGVISGARTAEEQHALWLQGRDESGRIVDQSKVVTHNDGYKKPSNHQTKRAIDIVAIKNGKVTFDTKEISIRAAYIIGFAAANGIALAGGVKWGWDQGHVELA